MGRLRKFGEARASIGADVLAPLTGRSNDLVRAGMVRLLSGVLPLYVVNEYPKSGGTWVGQMLGRALDVPFPRNRPPCCGPRSCTGTTSTPGG